MSDRSAVHESDGDLFTTLERLVMADPSVAAEMARQALAGIDRDGSLDDRLRVRRMLAMAHAHQGQFDLALATSDEAIRLGEAGDAPIETARVRLASMQPLAHLGRVNDAIGAGQLALDVFESAGDDSLTGRAALNVGSIHAMTGRHDDALRYFDRALGYLADEKLLIGQIETNRGTALAALDRFEAAEAAFSRAASVLDAADLSWAAAIVEGNLADLAARQGAINRSLQHFELSRRQLEEEGALGDLGRLNAEEATVLAMAGLAPVAHRSFASAIALLTEHGTPGDLTRATIAYARSLVDAGDHASAKATHASIQETIDPAEYPDLYQQYLALGVQMAIAEGDFRRATAGIDAGLLRVDDRPVQRLGWSILQAMVARALGEHDRALTILQETLDSATRFMVTPVIADVNDLLSGLCRDMGDDERADTYARDAIDGYEAIRGTIQASQLRQVWHHSRLGVYDDFAIALVSRDDETAQREAFGIVERIRSRALLDSMQSRSADVDLKRPVSERERPLIEELTRHRRWLNWMYSSIARGNEPTSEQLHELHEHERAAAGLSDRLAMLRPQAGLDTPLSLEAVLDHIDDETVVLSYLRVRDRYMVQVIDANGVHGVGDLAPAATVAELVSALQFQVSRALASGTATVSPRRAIRLRRDVDDILEQLYTVLVSPVASRLVGRNRALIVPSGDLHSLPFAALRVDGRYLNEQMALLTAPSVSVLANMVRADGGLDFQADVPLIVGVGDDGAPGLRDEARERAAMYPNPILLLDGQATKEAVLSSMAVADLIHVACHGRFDPAYPAASGLRVADDWLTLDDLREIHLNHPLVVLTGCETGRARVDRGDDLVGLLAALISAGASGLVTSMWKTHDDAARALATALYEALEQGHDLATALRTSQLNVRPEFDHPAWWAPFAGVKVRSKDVWV